MTKAEIEIVKEVLAELKRIADALEKHNLHIGPTVAPKLQDGSYYPVTLTTNL